MRTGIVFDIQRFALHDGPGIRTTVFLKGCPLRCLWCHNPESQQSRIQYSFSYDKCGPCQESGHACLQGVRLEAGAIVHDRALITPAAFDLCPADAITTVGREMSVAEIMAEVERDRAYYARSGGGLTISGGEPMQQFDFCLALAQAAKAAGLHVCLDTSGHAPRERFAVILPYVDLFLYDYKETDPDRHREFTKVAPDLIAANLELLCSRGAAVRLRCPLVPGLNDTPAHMQGIAALAARYPGLEAVEIMAYHDMGNHKAERVGQKAPLAGLKTVTDDVKKSWLRELHALGCTGARLG
ncbi:MAG TPA: glycyl-radical enzyme activating protein [Symbiobacteriaceae bacterium]|nr:glycyl-radical enzyme activating protein [Symbiobacteriaceae bacterium]